jgi:uncharacterized protein (TIGR03086 family)
MNIADWHARSTEAFAELVARVRDDQWALPTPCTEWDVRALVNHVVGEDLWTVPLMHEHRIADVGAKFDGDVLGADPKETSARAAGQAVAAVSEPGALDRTAHLSFGDFPATEYACQLFADHLIHGWDLAVAIGADPHLDPHLVGECTRWFAGQEEAYRQAGAVGPAVAVPEGAGDQERLLAAAGRDPRWSPAVGAVQRYLTAFDRRDVAATMATLTEDVVWENTAPPDGVRHEGAAAVRAATEEFLRDNPNAAFELEELVGLGAERAVARWRYSWPDGHVRGVDLCRTRAGKVAEVLTYVKG